MENKQEKPAVIILAAGLGKRMKSDKAKVLHEIMGKPMIMYVVETAISVSEKNVIVVVGNQAEKVKETVSKKAKVNFALQKEQLGTGHATLCAKSFIKKDVNEIIILCGDVPLLTVQTVLALYNDHLFAKRDLSLLAVEVDRPQGYGRVVMDEKRNLTGIIEDADATEEQKMIKIINTGIYCVNKYFLFNALKKIKSNNVQGELYLTDIVEIGYQSKKKIGVMVGNNYQEIIGVNSPEDLKQVENIMRND